MEYKDFEPSIIQENRILRLCKRLDKFTFDDISIIADDIEESELELILSDLVEKCVLSLKNDLYFYIKKKEIKPISTLKYFPPQVIDLVIRCFCTNITSNDAQNLCIVRENAMTNLYNYFRELIYERQKNELMKLYAEKPQICRMRLFFEKYRAYFYIYYNKVYIVDKPLKGENEKPFSKAEIKEFKKIYCYLTRIHCHNKNKINIHHKLADALWRREKAFEKLYLYLKLNIS